MPTIPKRIIQTGKHRDQPVFHQAVMQNLQLLNPDFEYLFFDDAAVEKFMNEEFPEYRAIFDAFPVRIQKYDFFRYLAVYRYGGFYFDLDVMLATGLSGLLDRGCVFPFEGLTFSQYLRKAHGMDWAIGNYAFGAAAGHPFLKAVIENCVRGQTDPAWVRPMMLGAPQLSRDEFTVLNTTGPGLISRTLAENPELASMVTVLFPQGDVCDLRTWNRFGDMGLHLMDGSWRSKTGFLRSRLAPYLELWKMRRLLKQSRKMGTTRQHPARRYPIALVR